MIVVSCISTCFYFSNILELKWQQEEEEEKDHTHIAEECNISDILLNLLLLCSVKLKCDEVFGIFSFSLGFRVSAQLHWSCLCTFQKKQKSRKSCPERTPVGATSGLILRKHIAAPVRTFRSDWNVLPNIWLLTWSHHPRPAEQPKITSCDLSSKHTAAACTSEINLSNYNPHLQL